MPIIEHTPLPSLANLRQLGDWVLPQGQVLNGFAKLHIGLLNIMPDGALQSTERQFISLLAHGNPLTAIHFYPFSLPSVNRASTAQAHIKKYYYNWQQLKKLPLDALIITGAHVGCDKMTEEPFWHDLVAVFDWVQEQKLHCLFSCLSAHAFLFHQYQQQRTRMRQKLWGLFAHKVIKTDHPLTYNINRIFHVPHSRFNDIDAAQWQQADLDVLIASERAGTHLAVSKDSRLLFMQGHPEYNSVSLLKEYKREVKNFTQGKRADFPTMPEHYFNAQTRAILAEYKEHVKFALAQSKPITALPESIITGQLINNWHDTAAMLLGNWLTCLYQKKHI